MRISSGSTKVGYDRHTKTRVYDKGTHALKSSSTVAVLPSLSMEASTTAESRIVERGEATRSSGVGEGMVKGRVEGVLFPLGMLHHPWFYIVRDRFHGGMCVYTTEAAGGRIVLIQ